MIALWRMVMRELGIYIHIPFCERKCLYCDFLSGPSKEWEREQYVKALIKDIELTGDMIKDRTVKTIYIGGGTPSVLSPLDIEEIMNTVFNSFKVDIAYEATVEVNPNSIDYFKLNMYKKCGINRLSMGLQSADNEELKLLGRLHTYEEFLMAYGNALKAGFENINIDVMSAIPGQTIKSYESTLKKVMRLRPKHISSYSLIIEEGTPFFEYYGKNSDVRKMLPDEETERNMYYMTKNLLQTGGYERYEISNYAREGAYSIHNTNYWLRKEYLGFGVGAASYFENERYNSIGNIEEYIKYVNKYDNEDKEYVIPKVGNMVLSKNNRMEESIFLGLRLTKGFKVEEFKKEFGHDIMGVYKNQISKYVKLGFMELREGVLKLTDEGIDVSNSIFADFML